MPEGDAVRRLADTFDDVFVGQRVRASSPQGRFAAGAAILDGQVLHQARAVGKHLFLGFISLEDAEKTGDQGADQTGDVWPDQWVHIHLGLYGWWKFSGDASIIDSGHGVMRRLTQAKPAGSNHTEQKWTLVPPSTDQGTPGSSEKHESREETGEGEVSRGSGVSAAALEDTDFWDPPEPVGQVRLRLIGRYAVADLSGPTRCELISDEERIAAEAKLGPDPLAEGARDDRAARDRFVEGVKKRKRPIGELVMDQSLIAGVGNIYRADGLFLAGLSPMRQGANISVKRLQELWVLFCDLMNRGLAAGRLDTMDPAEAPNPPIPGDEEASRWYVYHRTGRPCLRCGTPIAEKLMQNRRLFWCPGCQH